MRRGRLHRCAELLLLGTIGPSLGTVASTAAAQSAIQVPEGCGSEEEFRSEIERLTGQPAVLPAALAIEPIAGEPGGFELRLALGDELRVLRDPECRILWRSAIVIAAAAVRQEPPAAPAPLPTPPPPPPPPALARAVPSVIRSPFPARRAAPPVAEPAAATPPAPVSSVRQRESRPRPTPSRRRRSRPPPAAAPAIAESRRPRRPQPSLAPPAFGELHGGLALGVGVSGGVLPDLGGVLDVGGRLEVLPWALDLSLRYWPEGATSRDGRTVDVSGLGARFAGLYRVASALNVMAGLEVNRLVGEGGEGVSGRNADAVWQLAATAGFSLITWDIRPIRLEIGAAGRLSVARPRFEVTGFGDLYRVPLLGADAIIRGVWLFP
ncbi:MAG TPA: hypothetical protein VMG12_12205 [Polyangiaceae bacterium]|nr:hypothetical protein [Polyangiaceae bacterium]